MLQTINQTNIVIALDRLGIKHRDLGNGTLGVIEDGKPTDGWRVNIRDNYIHDFSGKGRANGPPFAFVKKYLNLTASETFRWFEDNFNIRDELKRPKNKGSPIKKKNMNLSSYSRKRLNQ